MSRIPWHFKTNWWIGPTRHFEAGRSPFLLFTTCSFIPLPRGKSTVSVGFIGNMFKHEVCVWKGIVFAKKLPFQPSLLVRIVNIHFLADITFWHGTYYIWYMIYIYNYIYMWYLFIYICDLYTYTWYTYTYICISTLSLQVANLAMVWELGLVGWDCNHLDFCGWKR